MPHTHSRGSSSHSSFTETGTKTSALQGAASDTASSLTSERVGFAELGVPQPLAQLLAKEGKTYAFPIQVDTLPDALAGRDILGRGRTGSGKTLAFALPLVVRLHEAGAAVRGKSALPHPRGLVLAPTRELVNQIDEVIQPLAHEYGMRTVTVYGGVSQQRQVAGLRAGADIVVACPGRLEDLLRQRELTLDDVMISVLDEADEMSDMGFLPAVTRLLAQVKRDGQHLLFSATLDNEVDQVVREFLHDAQVHELDEETAQVDTMTHHVFAVTQGDKHEVIRELASGLGKRILFTRTKYQAKNMAKKLVQQGIPAVDLQGNLSQSQRDRHLAVFASGEVRVLVATDVAARGIDVSDVALVVQTEPSEDPKSFLHRSGRTARAGEKGDVVTLVLPNQIRATQATMRRAGIRVKAQDVRPNSPVLIALVGEHAPLVEHWELPTPIQPVKRSRGGKSAQRRAKHKAFKDAARQLRQSRGSAGGVGAAAGTEREQRNSDALSERGGRSAHAESGARAARGSRGKSRQHVQGTAGHEVGARSSRAMSGFRQAQHARAGAAGKPSRSAKSGKSGGKFAARRAR